MTYVMQPPPLTLHNGIIVARDDLTGGGTKARFMLPLFEKYDEIVYATPAEGGAQTALAWAAKILGKKATLFVAKRKQPHPRLLMARKLGAKIFEVDHGYLSVVQKRAKDYCVSTGAMLAPFGLDTPAAIDVIAKAATDINVTPDEVWCASGSGTLARALAKAWPKARRHAVQIGRRLTPEDVAGATIHIHPLPFAKRVQTPPPFPSDWHYDAKAWEICQQKKGTERFCFGM